MLQLRTSTPRTPSERPWPYRPCYDSSLLPLGGIVSCTTYPPCQPPADGSGGWQSSAPASAPVPPSPHLLELSGTETLTPRRVTIALIPAPVGTRPRLPPPKICGNLGSSLPQWLGRNFGKTFRHSRSNLLWVFLVLAVLLFLSSDNAQQWLMGFTLITRKHSHG